MPIEYFVRYQGKCYDVGTKVRFYKHGDSYIPPINGEVEKFIKGWVYIRGENGVLYSFKPISRNFDCIIVEILEPVYYEEPPKTNVRKGVYPSENDIFIGWVWYILIMVVGTIFNARLLIWVVATAVFFSWKNGLLKGDDK